VVNQTTGEIAAAAGANMQLTWTPLPFARGETTIFNETKLGIIRHRGNVWTAYVGNKKLPDSKSKERSHKAHYGRN
jgi:hypothetical protein